MVARALIPLLLTVIAVGGCRRSPVSTQGEVSERQDDAAAGDESPVQKREVAQKSSPVHVTQRGNGLVISGHFHELKYLVESEELPILEGEEAAAFRKAEEFLWNWELSSFSDKGRLTTAIFLYYVLRAARQEQLPSRFGGPLQELSNLFMDLIIYKGRRLPKKPSFDFSIFREMAHILYSRGYNLGALSESRLDKVLQTARAVLWEGKKGERWDPSPRMRQLFMGHGGRRMKTDEAFLDALLGRPGHEGHGEYRVSDRLVLHVPAGRKGVVWLLVQAKEPDRRSMRLMEWIVKKRGGDGWALRPVVYLLDGAGPCALCLGREDVVGAPSLPYNMALSEWQYYGGKVAAHFLGDSVGSTLSHCYGRVLRVMVEHGVFDTAVSLGERIKRLVYLQMAFIEAGAKECLLAPTYFAVARVMLDPVGEEGRVLAHYLDILTSATLVSPSSGEDVTLFKPTAVLDPPLVSENRPYMGDPAKLMSRLRWLLTVVKSWPVGRKAQVLSKEFTARVQAFLARELPPVRVYIPPRPYHGKGEISFLRFRSVYDMVFWRLHKVVDEYALAVR